MVGRGPLSSQWLSSELKIIKQAWLFFRWMDNWAVVRNKTSVPRVIERVRLVIQELAGLGDKEGTLLVSDVTAKLERAFAARIELGKEPSTGALRHATECPWIFAATEV